MMVIVDMMACTGFTSTTHTALLRLPSDWFLFYKILNTTSLENFFLGKTVAGAPGASG